MTLARRTAAEGLGSAFLLAAVVGSGIMAERLAGGSVGLALLANAVATGAVLTALIATLGPLSGAHLNPLVSLAAASERELAWRDLPGYVAAQLGGAIAGVAAANAMFELPLVVLSQRPRGGAGQLLGEGVATFGLLLLIRIATRRRDASAVALSVGAYIAGAYWFTSSTSFANPAVTAARALTDSFAGIQPIDVPGFVAMQLLGAATATLFARWLVREPERA